MITATYFGEITELDSRAVWYSDEEDEDEDEDGEVVDVKTPTKKFTSIEPINHETIRANIPLNFKRIVLDTKFKFSSCIISLSSSSQFKNLKLGNHNSLPLLGHFDTFGKAFAFPIVTEQQQQDATSENHLLWLLFDSSNQYISGHEVGYFVEILREKLQREFEGLNLKSQIIILSQQYSNSEYLEFLSNFNDPTMKLPFLGKPILPPSLIKSQFESALFEQLTLSLKQALVVCLPNPKNFWFHRTKNWPSIPDQIIEHKLNDDNLEKTNIFI